MATVLPTSQHVFDTRDGYHYIVMTVKHTNGADSLIPVPDAALSAAELPGSNAAPTLSTVAGDNTAAVNPSANELAVQNATSGDSGLGFTFATNDGVKQVIIDTASTSGTYTLVVRCAGSAAGLASTGAGDQ